MMSRLITTAVFTFVSSAAFCADTVVGEWKTLNGETSAIEQCDAGYCIVAKSGKYAGRKIGTFTESGGSYVGKITDPRNNVTYSGKITVSGGRLKLRGCATDVLCKTQTWNRAN